MTLAEAQEIMAAVKENPPTAEYTREQVALALKIISGTPLAPPEQQ